MTGIKNEKAEHDKQIEAQRIENERLLFYAIFAALMLPIGDLSFKARGN